jgi:hypothetical protein
MCGVVWWWWCVCCVCGVVCGMWCGVVWCWCGVAWVCVVWCGVVVWCGGVYGERGREHCTTLRRRNQSCARASPLETNAQPVSKGSGPRKSSEVGGKERRVRNSFANKRGEDGSRRVVITVAKMCRRRCAPDTHGVTRPLPSIAAIKLCGKDVCGAVSQALWERCGEARARGRRQHARRCAGARRRVPPPSLWVCLVEKRKKGIRSPGVATA